MVAQKINNGKWVLIPKNSLIEQKSARFHYSDAYQIRFSSNQEITAVEVMRSFFLTTPAWVVSLMKLRNFFAKRRLCLFSQQRPPPATLSVAAALRCRHVPRASSSYCVPSFSSASRKMKRRLPSLRAM